MTAAWYSIILAAGAGSRFGGSKLTAIWNGKPLIAAALRAAGAAPVAGVIVVVGAHRLEVSAAIADFLEARTEGPDLRVVQCERWATGMSASLQCGLSAVPPGAAGAFIFLGDMPCVPLDLPSVLLSRVGSGAQAAAPYQADRQGHPVLITAPLFDRLGAGGEEEGGRGVLRNLGAAVARVEVEEAGVFFDVDDPEDLSR